MLDPPQYFELLKNGLSWKPLVLDSNWAKIFNTEIIKKNKIRFNENISMFEDCLFNIDYLKNIQTVKCINKPVYFYRVAEESLSRTLNKNRVQKRIDFMKNLYHRSGDEFKDVFHFFIGQNMLRTAVVAMRKFRGEKQARFEIKSFIQQKEFFEILKKNAF